MGYRYYDKEKYNKEWLYQKYCVEFLSTNQIAEIIGCKGKVVHTWLVENETPTRNRLNGAKIRPKPRGYDRTLYTKEWFYEEYFIKKLSLNVISKNTGLSRKTLADLMDEYGLSRRNYIESAMYGSNNPNWKGGRERPLPSQVRRSKKYKNWRTSVFVRDNRACVLCKSTPREINADHIKPFAVILLLNNVKSLSEAKLCKELFDINNGRTLCQKCHRETETYGQTVQQWLAKHNNSVINITTDMSPIVNPTTTIPSLTSHVNDNLSANAFDIIFAP